MELPQAVPVRGARAAGRGRAAAAALALALAVALSGGFALGRVTPPALERPGAAVGQGSVSARTGSVPRGIDVDYRPRHHLVGQGWMAGIPTAADLIRPAHRRHQ
jgi:hypothetical protein